MVGPLQGVSGGCWRKHGYRVRMRLSTALESALSAARTGMRGTRSRRPIILTLQWPSTLSLHKEQPFRTIDISLEKTKSSHKESSVQLHSRPASSQPNDEYRHEPISAKIRTGSLPLRNRARIEGRRSKCACLPFYSSGQHHPTIPPPQPSLCHSVIDSITASEFDHQYQLRPYRP